MKKSLILLLLIATPFSNLWSDLWEDIGKALKITAESLNLYNQINTLRAQQAMIQQVTVQQTEIMRISPEPVYSQRQEEWNRWNGLVSLLNEKQKQTVLQFNLLSDKELLNLWIAAMKSTRTYPAEFLMPSKYDSVSKEIYDYLIKDELDIDLYLGTMRQIDCKDRVSIWRATNLKKRSKIETSLKTKMERFELDKDEFYFYYSLEPGRCAGDMTTAYNSVERAYQKYLDTKLAHTKMEIAKLKAKLKGETTADFFFYLDKNQRKQKWKALDMNTRNKIKKELEAIRHSSLLMNEYEYTAFLNFNKDTWDERTCQRLYRQYQREKGLEP